MSVPDDLHDALTNVDLEKAVLSTAQQPDTVLSPECLYVGSS